MRGKVGVSRCLAVELMARGAGAKAQAEPRDWARRLKICGPSPLDGQCEARHAVPDESIFDGAAGRVARHSHDEESWRLLVAGARTASTGGLRPETCEAVFGLARIEGLRVSEALPCATQRRFTDGTLTVRHTGPSA